MTKKETSPRRAAEAAKRPKVARKQSISQNNSTKTQDPFDSSRPKFQAFVQEPSNGDADAMDVDSKTPPIPSPSSNGVHSAQVPSNSKAATTSSAIPNGSTNGQSRSNTTATATKPPPPTFHNISGLGNVEPFLPSQNINLGLDSLKDTLPFPSQSANSHPTKPNTAQKLKYPDMPGAPVPPTILNQVSTCQYFSRMGSYVKAYREYRKSLTGHLVARDTELESLEDNFINTSGRKHKEARVYELSCHNTRR